MEDELISRVFNRKHQKDLAYPACYGSDLLEALRVTKEWVASVEDCMSIVALPIPSSDAVIAAVSKFSDERLPPRLIADAGLEELHRGPVQA